MFRKWRDSAAWLTLAWGAAGLLAAARADEPNAPVKRDLFANDAVYHNHASCVVECPNSDLLVAWYRGSGERDADDVEILAARLKKGQTTWGPVFPLIDTPGYPDCNPALLVGDDGSFWVFRPTILDHRWEGALLKFARADACPEGDAAPVWNREGVLHLTPVGLSEAIQASLDRLPEEIRAHPRLGGYLDEVDARRDDELYQRLGWMPRCRPVILSTGRWILPLYTDTYSVSLMAYSDDRGATWNTGRMIPGIFAIQPAVVERSDGSLVAYCRNAGAGRRILSATSNDGGVTWSEAIETTLPNPGAGVDAIRLASGKFVLVYNDTEIGRHSLAVALSNDEGRTWNPPRFLERQPPDQGAFHYPSILQTRDGQIHVLYTAGKAHRGETIRHAVFHESWLGSE
ncbi:neuraminidase (sialidase)-like protein [Isosphaera pallida ATCC 43644]|uniref:Neuraminidase (Sialidase)-like protein n=1 Tax=Isosphaera pallida (strain ATCC 43644 / DSM 9630 / IS1B) TaxID=575540 RepID=E8QZQ9_ISOPI|nr:sialidase family protein [Isosphaera pallida]ADV62195.1 neuraminidase (sialidase)-like protein [Isosphaera pallida ATCC 43644]